MSEALEETIQKLIKLEQMFTEPEFMCEIEDLINENLHIYDDGEQSNRGHEVYLEFARKVEAKLEEFAGINNITEVEVYEHCKMLYDTDPTALTCFEYILSACDYNDFLEMMITRRELQQWRDETE